MTYACPAWKSAAVTHVMKLQRLQKKVLRLISGLPRRTPIRYMHTEIQIPYVYDFITKICRKQAEVIQNHDNENVHRIGSGEAKHRKHKDSNLVAVKLTIVPMSELHYGKIKSWLAAQHMAWLKKI
jgi:hypothetical protein